EGDKGAGGNGEEVGERGNARRQDGAGDRGSGQTAEAEEAVEGGHDRTPVAVLHRDGLRVHGDVQRRVACAEQQQRERDQEQVGAQEGEGQRQAEGHAGRRGHEAAAGAPDAAGGRGRPARPTSQPASGSAKTAPAAMESSTTPSTPSEIPWRALTAGMWGTQLASTNPLTKKKTATARRAWTGGPSGSRTFRAGGSSRGGGILPAP